MERTILHSDMNNFYASVECLYRPELRNKPIAVAGDPEQRHGIVLAKNYGAKAYGVQTGDPLWLARQKCRDIVFVEPHYDRYISYSKYAREIYSEYTEQVESYGLDECWLDVTGSQKLFGDGRHIADELRKRIRDELGITASVGVSFNKIFAKLGSDMKKPDATTVITSDHFKEQIWPLPASDLLFVGRATTKKLARFGIHTIGELAAAPPMFLQSLLGKNGLMLWAFANGRDSSPVSRLNSRFLIKSVGNSTTAPRDLVTDQDMRITLYMLCESVAERLREQQFAASVVKLTLRDSSLFSYERQAALPCRTSNAQDLFDGAYQLYQRNHRPGTAYRSVGVRACNLTIQDSVQLSLFPEQRRRERQANLEEAIDTIRSRYGHFAIQRGLMLTDLPLSALDPKNDHTIHPEPFSKS